MKFRDAVFLLIGAICSIGAAFASAADIPSTAVGITFDTNNIYNWSIWQFDLNSSSPAHTLLADIPGYPHFPPPLECCYMLTFPTLSFLLQPVLR
jgi:hypothetical protein